MRVVKKINNNVAICIDDNDHELIAFGKGIGFYQTPYELNDLSQIHRTYYGINSQYYDLLANIPEEIFEIASKIVEYATLKIDKELNQNVVFTLADHIHFAIQRYNKNINLKMPISYDVQYFYDSEMLVGKKAVAFINKIKKIQLPKDEAVGIAIHFINAENPTQNFESELSDEVIIKEITKIIEEDFSLKIDKDGFNYSRFVSHMFYLLKRKNEKITITSQNQRLFNSMKNEFIETYNCIVHIKEYLKVKLNWDCSQEELLYIMLHINRLCIREDCNR